MIYDNAFTRFTDKEFDEKYALISHAIQLGDTTNAKKYRDILKKKGIDASYLPSAELFNRENKIELVPEKNAFTFIDLFAGIGGFRIAMQKLGGKCVFSSELNEPARSTYFRNYGEVPFGDITIPATKALIPDQFDVLCAGFPCQPFSSVGLKKDLRIQGEPCFIILRKYLEIINQGLYYLKMLEDLLVMIRAKPFKLFCEQLQEWGIHVMSRRNLLIMVRYQN